ncbi:transcriptional regulator, TetR family [Burkholderia sp. GAS332]|nr:transcriptional regulator, TetR family [Burkholderia sp. GAS332]
MLTRDHWIAAGFDALDSDGYSGISAEQLARRLNVTRGSFHHHFRGRQDFVRALLAQWELDYTDRMLAYAAQGCSLEDVLARYFVISAEKRPGREIAIRAWARRDPLVAEYQNRVDSTRLSFAISVCRSRIEASVDADLIGRLAHVCLIGGQQSGDRNQIAVFAHLVREALTLLRNTSSPNRT